MREIPLSNCERDFLLKVISQKKRVDGRAPYDYRNTSVKFGVDRGCVQVELGKTLVLAQVSCEVSEPKQARPNEGTLFVNVELSAMAAPQFEAGRQSDQGVEINRLLERCIKESRCVDTESLCIMAGVKVWSVRVDVSVLNDDGNLIDCASVAAISALAHFRRPDVTVSGEDVTIHSLEDRDPVPLSVHHMPLCITFAFFDQGKYLLVDPTEQEERVMDGKMVIGMNKHREICTFQMTGSMLLLKDQVLRCSNIAVVKVTEMTELIHRALENDAKARASGAKFGFAASIETKKITANQVDSEPIQIAASPNADSDTSDDAEEVINNDVPLQVKIKGPGTGQLGEGGPSTWDVDADMEQELMAEEEGFLIDTNNVSSVTADVIELDDSEEEEVTILNNDDLQAPAKVVTTEVSNIDLSKALKTKGKKGAKKSKNRYYQ